MNKGTKQPKTKFTLFPAHSSPFTVVFCFGESYVWQILFESRYLTLPPNSDAISNISARKIRYRLSHPKTKMHGKTGE